MAEITTNFKGSNNGDLGKNLVSKEYLQSVYPQLASSILGSGNLIIGLSPGLVNSSIPLNFDNFNNWKYIAPYSDGMSGSGSAVDLFIIKNNGTLWTYIGTSGAIYQKHLRTNSTTILDQEFTSATNWKQVSQGYANVAAVKTNGTLWVWGDTSRGLVRSGSASIVSTPVQEFSSSSNWKEVACGYARVLGIKNDGTLWAWGRNTYWGDLPLPLSYLFDASSGTFSGNPYISIPTQVGSSTDWDSIVSLSHQRALFNASNGVGSYSELAKGSINYLLKKNNTLWVWGFLPGPGVMKLPGHVKLTPVSFNIAASYTWKTVPSTLIPENKTIVAASENTSAIRSDGSFWSFGNSYTTNGNPGFGVAFPFTGRVTFAQESTSSTNWKQIDSNGARCLGIKSDGTLWSTGSTYNGANIAGYTGSAFVVLKTFSQIGTDSTWKQVSAGLNFAAGIKNDGSLWTWGVQRNYAVGGYCLFSLTNGLVDGNTTPVRESTSSTWSQVSIGGNFGAAIKTDGTLWTWGSNNFGQLGVNDNISRTTLVQEFTSSNNWIQVSASSRGTTIAAIKNDGSLWTWGYNNFGQLGNNSSSSRLTPSREFSSQLTWKYVSVGSNNMSAIKIDGTLWTWGYNYYGQLGRNIIIERRSTPVQEWTSSTNWNCVDTGEAHVIALKNDGTLWGWGGNPLGTCGSSDWNRNILTAPTQETNRTVWSNVSAVTSSSQGINRCESQFYGIKPNGTLWRYSHQVTNVGIFGDNPYDVTPFTQMSPRTADWKSVYSSNNYVSAIKTDGTLWQGGPVRSSPTQSGYNYFYNYTLSYAVNYEGSLIQERSFSNDWKRVFISNSVVIGAKSNSV